MSASTKIGMAVLEPGFVESPKARWLGAVEVLAGNNRRAMRVHYIIFESERSIQRPETATHPWNSVDNQWDRRST
jgi:hypothetical protein